MNIWIDLTNSPHVNFFEYFIKDLQQDHEVLLTCRPLANTIELLDLFHFSYHIIGKHYGPNAIKKMAGYPFRVAQLYRFLRNKKIDIAISHSSFYSPFVSKSIGARCIYLNDNEHAAGNRISFIFADLILIPEFMDERKILAQWGKSNKIIKYPGLKEGIYLWNYESKIRDRITNLKNRNQKNIYIRPEPSSAQYYKGRQNFLDELLFELQTLDSIRTVLLPRTKDQEDYYRQEKFKYIYVPKKSIPLSQIMDTCNLFIGAGGTMTREAALLGIPTVSIYQDKLLDVDKYLIDSGCMFHQKQITSKQILNYLERAEENGPSKILLQKGKTAYYLILKLLLNNADVSSINLPNQYFDLPTN
jgi:predicted glycosyltransferase